MTEFEKIMLLYIAHNAEMLSAIAAMLLAPNQRSAYVNGRVMGGAAHELAEDIRGIASPETLTLLRDRRS